MGRIDSLHCHRGSFHYYLSRLADLLAKDSTSMDPAHVINISSVASIIGDSEDSLSAPGSGVWSCESYSIWASVCFILHLFQMDPVKLQVTIRTMHFTPSKTQGGHSESSNINPRCRLSNSPCQVCISHSKSIVSHTHSPRAPLASMPYFQGNA